MKVWLVVCEVCGKEFPAEGIEDLKHAKETGHKGQR